MSARPPLRPRADKWYVGAGDGLIWAPPFPAWLEAPGFWDEAHLFQYAVAPLFAVTFVRDGAPLAARCRGRRWLPATLVLDHTLGPALRARETREAVGGGTLVSRWEIRNSGARPVTLDAVCWTAVDGAALAAGDARPDGDGLAFTRGVTDRKGHAARVAARLALTPRAQSHAGYRSQISTPVLPPDFHLTPFWDRWQRSGRLRGELHLDGIDAAGLVFLGLQRRLRIPARGRARLSAAISLALEAPDRRLTDRRSTDRPLSWDRFWSTVPSFTCSDRFLEHHWWYRWYGLRVNGIAAGAAPNYAYPTVTEGIGYFHNPISYSAQCHLRELRWLADPAWARGVLRTFLRQQRADGSLPGRVYADHAEGADFYHADWGGALEALEAVHPDAEFLAEAAPGLGRYGAWLLATRDRDGSGMLDVTDQYETGQEYMSRYEAVDPDADRYGWENRIRLKGIDVTVYGYRLFRALERLAAITGAGDAAAWRAAAERAARAVRERMWDAAAGLFSDVNPATGRRTGVKAAVCFYPYFTDLTGAAHVAGMERHLFDRRAFWTPFPVPSSSVDDPRFDPDAEWKGKRHNCPWNGRVWPMTNAHVIEALARVVRAYRPDWAPRLGHLLRQFVRMMTWDGDPERPNCFEHYHPYSGRGSVYRGIDDYQHSWVNDLIVQHLLGVLPHGPTGVTVQPLALGVARAAVDGLPVAGHRLRVAVTGGRFTVAVDGRAAGAGRVGEPLTIAF